MGQKAGRGYAFVDDVGFYGCLLEGMAAQAQTKLTCIFNMLSRAIHLSVYWHREHGLSTLWVRFE